MTPLMYFTTFGLALVLFASSIVLAAWVIFKLIKGCAGIYLAITRPETRVKKKPVLDPNPNSWKRAGQW